jgi:hypothetical protein
MTRARAGLFVGLVLHAVGASAPGAGLEAPVIFTQLPRQPELERQRDECGGMLPGDYGRGGRIVRLDPDGRLRVLTEDFESACGADVSFDGQRVLFAARRRADDPWSIWEMNADGGGARRITPEAGNCRSPVYLSTLYTLTSAEPSYQIAFVSDLAGQFNEYGCGLATSLYTCGLDGSGLRRITFNLSDDRDPLVMGDGRVLLASWQRMDLERGCGGRVALFGVNPDGTDYALYCGDEGRRIKHMPCVTADGLVVFVEAERVPWDGAGQLACVTTRRNLHSYRAITCDEKVLYHSPAPLPDGRLLVSRRAADGSTTHGLYRLDPRTGAGELVFDDPNRHDVYARALIAQRRPDGRSSAVNEEEATGKLYCLDAYIADPVLQPHLRRGLIRRLRVLEGVPARGTARDGGRGLVPRRIVGDFAVEDDGSFHIELPANLAVQLQTVDENGMALATCGWIWVKPREPRGCIGCHEDPELAPENRLVRAMQKPAVDLTLPAERRRTVEFRRDVQPILDSKCVHCHQGQSGSLDLRREVAGGFNRAYVSLLAAGGAYVHPGQARSSPLIWRLYGRNTARPWDDSCQTRPSAGVCPPPGADPLTDDEKRAFVEWIDLGAPWDGTAGGQVQR